MNYFVPFAMLARKLHLARQKEGGSPNCANCPSAVQGHTIHSLILN